MKLLIKLVPRELVKQDVWLAISAQALSGGQAGIEHRTQLHLRLNPEEDRLQSV